MKTKFRGSSLSIEDWAPYVRSLSVSTENQFRRDGEDDDSNDNNPSSASRGNWWQGKIVKNSKFILSII